MDSAVSKSPINKSEERDWVSTLQGLTNQEALVQFLEDYQSEILIPYELPAIIQAHRHASRGETIQLVAFDQCIAVEPVLNAFADSSRRVGQAELIRLRPLRDHRLVQKYLRAVESGRANGWHTLVYGVTLSVYSMSVSESLHLFERQELLGFIRTVSHRIRLSLNNCEAIIRDLVPDFTNRTQQTLGEIEVPR